MPTHTTPETPLVSYEEMLRAYQAWHISEKTETDVDLFKRHGWSRKRFFAAITFGEMKRLYEDWFHNDKTGTQAAVFTRYGWSRDRYFDEESRRADAS
ncbi:hypothetical protein D3C71_24400 [compost metagenome]